jgi:uncharacterized coiled-coil protein SlyX
MSDLTVEILKDIRDGVRQTNQKLEETKQELSERLDRLEQRQTETEIRLATELSGVVGAVDKVRDALLVDRKLRDAVANHEARIRKLEKRRVS